MNQDVVTPADLRLEMPSYRHAGRFMLRAPLLPAETIVGRESHREAMLRAMAELSGTQLVEEAVRLASPSAWDGVARAVKSPYWLPGAEAPGAEARQLKRTRRAQSTLFRYLTRMSTRPTPFGMFAGVGFGRFHNDGHFELRDPLVSKVVARPDAAAIRSTFSWTMADLTAAEFPLRTNGLVHQTKGFVHLDDVDGGAGPERNSVRLRNSAAVSWALNRVARDPLSFGRLGQEMTEAFQGVDASLVESMLAQLIGARLLIPSIQPEVATTAPAEALLELVQEHDFAAAQRDWLADATARADLLSAHLTITARDSPGGWMSEDDVDRAAVQVDTALDLAGQSLPLSVGEAAEEMAGVLSVLGSTQPSPVHLDAYLEVFLERYGSDSAVPLMDLLSSDTGLGPPDSYSAPQRHVPLDERPVPASPALGILLSAVVDCLQAGNVHLQIVAPSLDAVRADDFTAVLAPSGSTDGLRTFGRFSHLMDEEWRTFMEDFAVDEESRVLATRLGPRTMVVETHYLPGDGRSANVTFHHRIRRNELNVNAFGSFERDSGLMLADIVVRADQDGFRFEHARTGLPLHFVQSHLLNYASAPNPVRFLLEVSDQRFAPPAVFDWGELSHAPFLPRVSRGRLVLCPATWRLSGVRLGLHPDRRTDSEDEVRDRLQAWLARYRVPRRVMLTQADNRLLFDTEQPLALDELVQEILRDHSAAEQRGVVLQEAWSGADAQWLTDSHGRAFSHEIVVPVLARGVSSPEPAHGESSTERNGAGAGALNRVRAGAVPPVQVRPEDCLLAGEQWTSLILHTAPENMTAVIEFAGQFFSRLHQEGLADRWFYVCYADHAPLLRLRFRSTGLAYEDRLLASSVRWARTLNREHGLVSDVQVSGFVPEIARYGGPLMWESAQELFHADSEVARGLRRLMLTSDLPAEVWGATSLVRQLASWADGAPHGAWADEVPEISREVRKTFKDHGRLIRELAGTGADRPLSADLTDTALQITDICRPRDELVLSFASRLQGLSDASELSVATETVLGSITHLSMNRLLGIDRSLEIAAGHLAMLVRPRRQHNATRPLHQMRRLPEGAIS